jgi:chemotaxis protein CheZ
LQRKVFRIEAMLGKPRASTMPKREQQPHARAIEYESELGSLLDVIRRSERELAALRSGAPLPRMQSELRAAIAGMDEATQKILRSTEAIDESARALQASLQNEYNRGLAQDVLDQALQIYETCNFQDLAGQRINKAIAALKLVEQQVARLCEIWGKVEQLPPPQKLINGPRLAGDTGHADQSEVDRIFATG